MECMDDQECENNQEGEVVRVWHAIRRDLVRVEISGKLSEYLISRWEFQLDVLYVQPLGSRGYRFLPEAVSALLETESWIRAESGDVPFVTWIQFAQVTEQRLHR